MLNFGITFLKIIISASAEQTLIKHRDIVDNKYDARIQHGIIPVILKMLKNTLSTKCLLHNIIISQSFILKKRPVADPNISYLYCSIYQN